MKNLIIIGAGEFGREVYNWAINSIDYQEKWIVKGFLDDRKNILSGKNGYPEIIDSVENYKVQNDDLFICTVAEPKIKRKYIDIIKKSNGEFCNIIHNSCVIGLNVKIGTGNVFCPHTVLTCDIRIGDNNIFNVGTVIGHDVTIMDNSSFMVYVVISGHCDIGDSVFIGSHSNIIPKTKIGDNAFVGAGSNVIKNIECNQKVFGNPARFFSNIE